MENLFVQFIEIVLDIQMDNFVYRYVLQTTIFATFPSRSMNYTMSLSYLQKTSMLTIGKLTNSTRAESTMQTLVRELRAFTMRGTVNPYFSDKNSVIDLIGNV